MSTIMVDGEEGGITSICGEVLQTGSIGNVSVNVPLIFIFSAPEGYTAGEGKILNTIYSRNISAGKNLN